MHYILKIKGEHGDSWLSGSLVFRTDDDSSIKELAISLDTANEMEDIIWTNFLAITVVEAKKMEEKLLAIVLGAHACSESQVESILTILENLSNPDHPCLKIGLINFLMKQHGSVISEKLKLAMNKYWHELIDDIENHYIRIIEQSPKGVFLLNSGEINSIYELTDEFTKTFRKELAKGNPLHYVKVNIEKSEPNTFVAKAEEVSQKYKQDIEDKYLYRIMGTDSVSKRDAWWLVRVNPLQSDIFSKIISEGNLRLTDYGEILTSGFGSTIPPDILKEYGFRID